MNTTNDKIMFGIATVFFSCCVYALLTQHDLSALAIVILIFFGAIAAYVICAFLKKVRVAYTIPKGWRYCLPMFPWLVKTNGFDRTIVFDESCAYNLQSTDQQDWNKLTGFSFKLFTVHKDSVRVAWRYNIASKLIELMPYSYVGGVRTYDETKIASVAIGEEVNVRIVKSQGGYDLFLVIRRVSRPFFVKSIQKKYAWLCYPYFGGTSKAPHTIKVKI